MSGNTIFVLHVIMFRGLGEGGIAPNQVIDRSEFEVHREIYKEGRKEMFYLTTHSTHFIYGYMASDIWLRTILIVRKATLSD